MQWTRGQRPERWFIQCHIFCTPEQVEAEVAGCIDFTLKVLESLAFENFRVRLGFRDPKSDKYVGPPELPPHQLEWLDHEEGPVSGNRGFARRVDSGTYAWIAPPSEATAAHRIRLQGGLLSGELTIAPSPTGLHARLEAMIRGA